MDRHAELAAAADHVERGERLVERQRETVARLEAQGFDVELARELLDKLEMSLATLRDHRDLVSAELQAEEAESASRDRPSR